MRGKYPPHNGRVMNGRRRNTRVRADQKRPSRLETSRSLIEPATHTASQALALPSLIGKWVVQRVYAFPLVGHVQHHRAEPAPCG